MIIGHYGVGYALKRFDRKISLGWLVLSVHLIDIIHHALSLLGVEKYRITQGFTQVVPVDIYFYPYSHSLPMAFFWAGLAFLVFYFLPVQHATSRLRMATILAVGTFSHFAADILMHVADLPIWWDGYKIGLGLWQYRWPALLLEIGVLFGGLWIYMRSTASKPGGIITRFFSRWGQAILCLLISVTFIVSVYTPLPSDTNVLSAQLLVTYAVITGLAFWLDGMRIGIDDSHH